ncbi:ABC transporter ATP-binding protein [candidate division KSB1 bacterium]|nr:ABC transporter ATP-binding protein [candidate division KSB1 bacterium]
MSDIAIKVENISKRYRIGLKEELHDTLIGSLTSWVKYPLSNFRRVQKLSKFIGDGESEDIIWALKDVSFDVKHGEVLGIIGKNGAGKSTLLKILCRITEPTSGWAEANGRVASLLEVGTGFHGELTGRENVYLNGTLLGMNKAEVDCKFDEIVEFSGIEKFIDTPVKRYSSGMNVRLGFAVAAHLDPEILLIDEVLAVGDYEFQKKCLGKMKDFAGEGRTVLFVSHNIPSVINLCNRGIVLDSGMISYEGSAVDAVNNYLSATKNVEIRNAIFKNGQASSNYVELKDIRFTNKKGEKTKHFMSNEPITIEIEYVVKTRIEDLLLKLLINDNLGNPFLATSDLDYPTRAGYKVKEPGVYISKCTIPPNTFGTNTFYIDLIITKRKTFPYYIDLRKIDSFETILFHSNIMNYGDMYGSPMRPDFEWKITRID